MVLYPMISRFRFSALLALALLALLPGCRTTQSDAPVQVQVQANSGKAYVVVGREVAVEGWRQYYETNNGNGVQTAAQWLRGLPSGRKLVFRRYEEDRKIIAKGDPDRDDPDTFVVDASLVPLLYQRKIDYFFYGDRDRTKPDISFISSKLHGESAVSSENGYVIYDLYEVPPGNWALERHIYDDVACRRECGGFTRYNVLHLKRGNVTGDALGFAVAEDEIVYIGDAKIELDIIAKDVVRKDHTQHGLHGPAEYQDKNFYVRNIRYSLSVNEERMKRMMRNRLDVSKVVTRPLGAVQ